MNGPATDTHNEQQPAQQHGLPLERLALIYEDIFTVIVRVQSGKQQIERIEAFRDRVKSVLNTISQAAKQRGYSTDHVEQANFAVVAFLDEAVLASNDAGRTEWARKTLQEEMFQQRSAGELFFQHLDRLRAFPDSSALLQVLEIYYMCLLLGYEGKYAVGSKGELYLLMDNIRGRIEHVAKYVPELSPDAAVEIAKGPTTAQLPADPALKWTRLIAAAAAVFALASFVAFKVSLYVQAAGLQPLLSRLSPPGL